MKTIERQHDEWCRCKKCGHKLFRKIGFPSQWETPDIGKVIEIKCHSCKELNEINL